MLIELAVGDAYGVGFENCEQSFVDAHNNLRYVTHDIQPSLIKPGCYSDDTQMTLAIVEAMLSDQDWVPELLAQRFVDVFKRDERRGYAGEFFKFLTTVTDGKDFLAKIIPSSNRGGAAMRACPLGLVKDMLELRTMTIVQANITHNTPEGRQSALAAALMVYYFNNDVGPKSELGIWLANNIDPGETLPLHTWDNVRYVSTRGWDVIRAAFTAIQQHDSMTTILKQCIAYGGDTDTVATIAMAAASVSREVKSDLDDTDLISGLENGTYGWEYLENLDLQLDKAYG